MQMGMSPNGSRSQQYLLWTVAAMGLEPNIGPFRISGDAARNVCSLGLLTDCDWEGPEVKSRGPF